MKKIVGLVLALLVSLASLATPIPGVVGAQLAPQVQEIEIVVRGGYQPSRITVREGEPVRLRFVRQEYSSCTREVVLPWLGLRRELPPHEPVVIELPPMRAGEHELHCGMNMVRATLVVVPR